MSASVPVIHPASIGDILSFGLFGFAMSRYSGLWGGFKSVSELIEAGQTVDLAPLPDFEKPALPPTTDGLHVRWPDAPGLHLEERMEAKLAAAAAFAVANPIDRVIHGNTAARMGIITVGKAHGDLMEALRLIGLDADACRRFGIDIYKVGLVWPIEQTGAAAFMNGKAEILVVEEKRGIVEEQIRALATRMGSGAPGLITGKTGAHNHPLIPTAGELAPDTLLPLVAERLDANCDGADFCGRAARLTPPPTGSNSPA
ncbi:MAG TPA: pyruvate ferredoxin oxidoreductase, partial [Alphaproteobacteria bacterium]|nr:pyruvate ferredoxin oxidoreductase [Alphaproteobacteria bacterium]